MLGISKNMTRLRQLYEMRKSLLGNTSFISGEQKQEFMDLIKEIDSVEQKDYLVLLASKTYSTTSNSDELKRLKELVELIDERYKEKYGINLLKDKGLEILTIKRLITFKYSIYLLNELNIKRLRLDFASTVSLQDYEMFLEVGSLKEIDCYDINAKKLITTL